MCGDVQTQCNIPYSLSLEDGGSTLVQYHLV